jgi:hypothetical protein
MAGNVRLLPPLAPGSGTDNSIFFQELKQKTLIILMMKNAGKNVCFTIEKI